MAVSIGLGIDKSSSTGSAAGTSSSRKILSQEGMDKILKDILSSDQGLASLATGENLSGGFNATTKNLLAQSLVTDIAGQLANVTAETITTKEEETKQATSKKSGGLKTVICTELVRQGKLERELYDSGDGHFAKLDPLVVIGYHSWASKLVPIMQKSERLSNFFLPIARARYLHVTGRKRNLLGAATVWIGQPLCYIIGSVIILTGAKHGYVAN